jgi:hypothetical protein
MNHSDAQALGAVEKYYLGELTAQQHEHFEEHCFECAECATELRTLYTVKESIRRMPARSEVRAGRQAGPWLSWMTHPIAARLSLAASLSLATIVAYQNFRTIPQLSATLEAPALIQTLKPGIERRGSTTESMEYTVPLRFREGFTAYRIDLRTPDGTVVRSLEASVEQAQASEGIRLRRDKSLQGKIEVVVYGLNATLKPEELNRYVLDIP